MAQCFLAKSGGGTSKEPVLSIFTTKSGSTSQTIDVNKKVHMVTVSKWNRDGNNTTLKITFDDGANITASSSNGIFVNSGAGDNTTNTTRLTYWVNNSEEYKDKIVTSVRIETGSGDGRSYVISIVSKE